MSLGSMVKTETQRGFQVLSRLTIPTRPGDQPQKSHLRSPITSVLVQWRGADTHVCTHVSTVWSCSWERWVGSWKPTRKDLIPKQKLIKQVNSPRATSAQRSKVSMVSIPGAMEPVFKHLCFSLPGSPPPTSLDFALSPGGHPEEEDTGWGWGNNVLPTSR